MNLNIQSFKEIYSRIKPDLSYFTGQMIDTIYLFLTKDYKGGNKTFSKKDILMEYEKLARLVEKTCTDKILLAQVSILGIKIQNNEYYFDLLVKLQCALGIQPNKFFISIAQLIFYNKIYLNIINYKYYSKEELLFKLENILHINYNYNDYDYYKDVIEAKVI